MLGDNEYNGYTDIIEEIKGLAQQMQTGFETLMKALEGMNTKNTVCKSTFTSHQAEYVKYNDKILQLFIREDNTPLLVNVKDEDEIYDIDNFCLYSYQQVRLNRILGRRGWFNTNGATMSGIRVMKLQESNMWMQDPDDSTDFIPNMEWRFSTFHAELISYMNNNENIKNMFVMTSAIYSCLACGAPVTVEGQQVDINNLKDKLCDMINRIYEKYSPEACLHDDIMSGKFTEGER